MLGNIAAFTGAQYLLERALGRSGEDGQQTPNTGPYGNPYEMYPRHFYGGAGSVGEGWGYPKHASAERRLAFEHGVDAFCKESGFDTDDREAMYRFLDMEKKGLAPVLALAALAAPVYETGKAVWKGFEGMKKDPRTGKAGPGFFGGAWQSIKEDWDEAGKPFRWLGRWMRDTPTSEEQTNKMREEAAERWSKLPESTQLQAGIGNLGLVRRQIIDAPPAGSTKPKEGPLYDYVKRFGSQAPKYMASGYGLTENQFRAVMEEAAKMDPSLAQAIRKPEGKPARPRDSLIETRKPGAPTQQPASPPQQSVPPPPTTSPPTLPSSAPPPSASPPSASPPAPPAQSTARQEPSVFDAWARGGFQKFKPGEIQGLSQGRGFILPGKNLESMSSMEREAYGMRRLMSGMSPSQRAAYGTTRAIPSGYKPPVGESLQMTNKTLDEMLGGGGGSPKLPRIEYSEIAKPGGGGV